MCMNAFLGVLFGPGPNPSVKISILFSSNFLHFLTSKGTVEDAKEFLSLSPARSDTYTHAHALSLGLSFVYFDDNNFKKSELEAFFLLPGLWW